LISFYLMFDFQLLIPNLNCLLKARLISEVLFFFFLNFKSNMILTLNCKDGSWKRTNLKLRTFQSNVNVCVPRIWKVHKFGLIGLIYRGLALSMMTFFSVNFCRYVGYFKKTDLISFNFLPWNSNWRQSMS